MDEKTSTGAPASVMVDRDLCYTAAICLAYSMYELDDESKAVLLTKNGSNSDDPRNPLRTANGTVNLEDLHNPDQLDFAAFQELIMESAKACPFNAIIVKDKEGKQLWPLNQ